MQYIEILKLLVSLLPTLIQVVHAVEAAFPASGQGAQKLQMVQTMLKSAYVTASNTTLAFEQLWPVLQNTVGAVVTLANASGVFKKPSA